jgi:hypothetical protein
MRFVLFSIRFLVCVLQNVFSFLSLVNSGSLPLVYLVLNASTHVFHGSLADVMVRVACLTFSKDVLNVSAIVQVSVVEHCINCGCPSGGGLSLWSGKDGDLALVVVVAHGRVHGGFVSCGCVACLVWLVL